MEGVTFYRMGPTEKHSTALGALIIACTLLVMAALDYVTGQELVFSCTYLVPVALTAWWFGRTWTIVLSVLCGAAAFVVDEMDGFAYSHPGIQYWNAFTCFIISLVTGLVLVRLRRSLRERDEMNARLRDALQKLESSTAEIRKLQNGLQTVCAWTNRIKVGDTWMTPDEFLTTQLHLNLTHSISPGAHKEMHKDLRGVA